VLVLQGIDDVVFAGGFENTLRFPRVDKFGLDAMGAPDAQDARIAHVGDHHLDLRGEHAVVDGAENHIEIRARTRTEDSNAQFVPRAHNPRILSKTAVVERPGTSGRIRISAPDSS
jgi:hypothetical protein